ncbi:MAG: hypothetical protein FWC73_08015 [Defluviitaleaceae bacterium]|nr:hypothetical protein [Defluviitaleaceae bacterium]
MGIFLLVIWYIVLIIQMFLGYGTAYRLTRDGGDNGASLFGWLFAIGLAAIIPGLGFYLWNKYRDENNYTSIHYTGSKKPDWLSQETTDMKKTTKKSNWQNPYDSSI